MATNGSQIPESCPIGSYGQTIPLIGFGTAEFPFGTTSSDTLKNTFLHAIRLGYRLFDTAAIYQSEQPLGEAISDALRLGLVGSRDELFVTSKLWCADAHPDFVLPAIRNTLRNLKLEYLDLFLVHFPIAIKKEKEGLAYDQETDLLPMDFKSVWEAMEDCQKLGVAKSIGVSNFSIKKLEILLTTAKIPPAVNQVEISPCWQQKKLREFCEQKGIHVAAFSPLGGRGTIWGTNSVLESPILKQIAEAKGKTTAQVCIRWVYEQGVSVIMKSFNEERMKENMEIFDWKLNEEDLKKISEIPQRKAWLAHIFISNQGPYKSFEDFWDEEIIVTPSS